MNAKRHKVLIFDLDGTLIDSSASILAGFAAALEKQKITPKVSLTAQIIGPPLRQTLAMLAGTDDESTIDLLASDFKSYYDTEGYKATRVFPGIDQMLRQLKAEGFELHIATNKRILPTRLILEHLNWSGLFQAVYALDLRTPAFPNKAAMLKQLLLDLEIDKTKASYIGDRPEDGQAADKNELAFYAAEWGYSPFVDNEAEQNWTKINSPKAFHMLLL